MRGAPAVRGLTVVLVLLRMMTPARAEDPPPPPRPTHGSVGVGGALLLTGMDGGSRGRLEAALDVEPGGRFGRFGGVVALRAVDRDHRGLACLGIVFEAAAARPRLVIDLHADLGLDLDSFAPLVGGGVRTTLTIIGPLGIAFDLGPYLVIDGIADTRLVISSSTALVARW